MQMGTQQVFGVALTPATMEQLLDDVSQTVPVGSGPNMVFTINLDHVVKLRHDEQFRTAYSQARVVTADGAPVVAYARFRGAQVSRITGADLFAALMSRLDAQNNRCFFVLSNEALGEAICGHLRGRGFAPGSVAYAAPPLGFDDEHDASAAVARQIAEFRPTHLFFCLGAPKSEIWCGRHAEEFGDAHVLCVGASAEFYLGTKRRAPPFMRNAGLEWLWRWGQEPRRLSQRYLVSSWGFLGAVRDDLRHRRR
jgi:N-acetylglucosaminyldiphosphoundecaprenol N-acetyl-beta-D-mannosaminyltransferase